MLHCHGHCLKSPLTLLFIAQSLLQLKQRLIEQNSQLSIPFTKGSYNNSYDGIPRTDQNLRNSPRKSDAYRNMPQPIEPFVRQQQQQQHQEEFEIEYKRVTSQPRKSMVPQGALSARILPTPPVTTTTAAAVGQSIVMVHPPQCTAMPSSKSNSSRISENSSCGGPSWQSQQSAAHYV